MSRTFPEHVIREVQSMDGFWTLHLPKHGETIAPLDWSLGKTESYLVPGVWEAIPGWINYRGQAVARRVYSTARPGAARLVFQGVSHTARVFLDGREIGGHHNAFTPFAIDVPELGAGEHELLVHISNEHGEISALHVQNDYYDYGGINRPVELQLLRGSCYIRHSHFTTEMRDGKWFAQVAIAVVNLGADV
jgi:beta-glucuronidase